MGTRNGREFEVVVYRHPIFEFPVGTTRVLALRLPAFRQSLLEKPFGKFAQVLELDNEV